MPVLPGFIGPAYEAESLAVNAQRCVNWYLEQDPTGKQKAALYGTPGLRRLATIGTGPLRAAEPCDDSLLLVSGSEVYRVAADFTAILLLDIGNSGKPVFIAQAGKNALIVDGEHGTWIDWTGGAWTAGTVTAEGFPPKPATCTTLDGYFLTHTAGSQQFQLSAPFDAKTWDAADFAAKEGQNDPLVRIVSAFRMLHLVGARTTEVWQDSGNNDFPFVRIDGAWVEQGAASSATVREFDGALLWLGQNRNGQCIVWRMQGFQPTRISTHAQETEFSGYDRVDDAIAWTYQDKGHAFYVLSFPTPAKTWAFDITTQLWHERPYLNPTTGRFEQHRGACHAFFNGEHIVGDRADGRLYALDRHAYDDDGDPIVALRASPHVWNAGVRGMMHELEFFLEPGVGLSSGQGRDPQAMLRVSKDGGRTWPIQRTTSIGRMGEYVRRARFTRIANARDFVIELSISDPVRRVLIGANVEVS